MASAFLTVQVKETSVDNCPMPGSGERPKQVRNVHENSISKYGMFDLS